MGPTPTTGLRTMRRATPAMILISLASVAFVGVAAAMGPIVALAALAAVGTALAVLVRPLNAALILVGVVPAISGLQRGLPVPGLRLSEAVIVGLSAVVLVTADRRDAAPWGRLDWLALGYAVTTAILGIGNLLARGDLTTDSLGQALGPFQFVLLYRATVTALSSPGECRMALRFLLLASIPVSLVTTAQGLGLGSDIFFQATGFDRAADPGRAAGPFPHWHELGGFTLQIVLLSVAVWLSGSQRVLPQWMVVAVMALATLALIQTATLAPIIGAVVGALALSVWYGRMGGFALWVGGFAVAGVLLFGSLFSARLDQQYNPAPGREDTGIVPYTLAYRYEVWTEQYLPAAAQHLTTGYGPGTPPEVTWGYTESTYIEMLIRGGLPLLLVFVALMWAFMSVALRGTRAHDPDHRALGRTMVLVSALLVPLQFVAPYLVLVGAPHVLWALFGVLVGWRKSEARR